MYGTFGQNVWHAYLRTLKLGHVRGTPEGGCPPRGPVSPEVEPLHIAMFCCSLLLQRLHLLVVNRRVRSSCM